MRLTTSPWKNQFVMKHEYKPRNWTDISLTTKRQNIDMNIGTWNVLSWYRQAASIKAIRELEKYKMDIAAIQKIRWPGSGNSKSSKSVIIYVGINRNAHELSTGFVVRERLISNIMAFRPIDEKRINNYSLFFVH